MTKRTIERARQGLARVTEKVDEMKNSRKEELEQEYEKLVQGLRKARDMEDAGLGGPPVLPQDLLQSGKNSLSFSRDTEAKKAERKLCDTV